MGKNTKKDKFSRRSIHKIIAGSSVALGSSFLVPKTWKKPIVDSILLPAHAQMSTTTTVAPATTTATPTTTTVAPTTIAPTTTMVPTQ